MSRQEQRSFGRRRFLQVTSLACAALPTSHSLVRAHNNPDFREVLLLTIEIGPEPIADQPYAAYSGPFSLDLPKKTIELIWRISGVAAEGVTFGVSQAGKLHAEGLSDGSNSRVLRGDDIRIVDVRGASGVFSIDVYANVIDRSEAKES